MMALELLNPAQVVRDASADRLMIGAALVAPAPQYISRIPVTSFLLASQPEKPVPVLLYGSIAGTFLPDRTGRFARGRGLAMAAVLMAGVAYIRALARPIAFERILAAILGVPLAVVEFIPRAVGCTPRHFWGELGRVLARVLVPVSVIVVARVDRTARKRPLFSTVALTGANGPFGCRDAAEVAPSPLGAFAAVLGALVVFGGIVVVSQARRRSVVVGMLAVRVVVIPLAPVSLTLKLWVGNVT